MMLQKNIQIICFSWNNCIKNRTKERVGLQLFINMLNYKMYLFIEGGYYEKEIRINI